MVVVGGVVGVVGALVLVPWPASRVNRANFDKIDVGMQQTQVEELLGGPPGDYSAEPVMAVDLYDERVLMELGPLHDWWSEEGVVQVRFDEAGDVLWKRFVQVEKVPIGLVERLVFRLEHLAGHVCIERLPKPPQRQGH